jgi:hypothetical protein
MSIMAEIHDFLPGTPTANARTAKLFPKTAWEPI